jgi:hypothetical protein
MARRRRAILLRGGDLKYTISIYKCIHGVGFKKSPLWTLKKIQKFVTKERGHSRWAHRYQAQQSCVGQRNMVCPISYLCAVIQKTE